MVLVGASDTAANGGSVFRNLPNIYGETFLQKLLKFLTPLLLTQKAPS